MFKFFLHSDYRINCEIKCLIFLKSYKLCWLLTNFLKYHIRTVRYIIIGSYCTIGKKIKFPHPHNIIIGRNTIIGDNCTIYQNVTLGQNKGVFPTVKNNVIIYAGACIIGNVTIGNNAIVGANSVVTHDVPDNAIVAGIPARIIGYRSKEDGYY